MPSTSSTDSVTEKLATHIPRVSIGLPVFNGANYLEQALDSLLQQTYTDFELIISDNASTDNTQKICSHYAKSDKRIRYYRNDENIGAAPNFNLVVEKAKGAYFKWAAHDDRCTPTYLEECVYLLENNPDAAVAHSLTLQIDTQNKVEGLYPLDRGFPQSNAAERFYQHLLTPHFCLTIFGVMHTHILKRTPMLAAFVGSDRNLIGELLLYGKILVIEKPLFLRREHPDTSVSRFSSNEKGWVTWFDPNSNASFTPVSTSLLAYKAAINSSTLAPDEKSNCLNILTAWSERGFDYQGRPIAEQLIKERTL